MNQPMMFDVAGRAVDADSYAVGDITPFDTGALRDAGGHLVRSIQDVAQVVQTGTQSASTIASMFDGTKSVNVGKFNAPVGYLLLCGLVGLFIFNKGR